VVPLVAALLRARTSHEWLQRLTEASVPHAEVWDYATLFEQEQSAVRGLRLTVRDPSGQPMDLIGSPFHIAGAATAAMRTPPALGQDTDAVLGELLGFDAARLAELRRDGVI